MYDEILNSFIYVFMLFMFNPLLREIVGPTPETFYVFFSSGDLGRHAFFISGIVWADQEVILYNPRFVGTYKELPVIEMSDPFIPMRTAVEIYDAPTCVPCYGLEIESCPFVHEDGKTSDKDVKTYRLDAFKKNSFEFVEY